MDVRILGSLEVAVHGHALPLRGRRRRALFAYLAINAGQVVSMERIVEDVWDGDPPGGARGTVKTYVWQFRKLLAEHGDEALVRTTAAGYSFFSEGVAVDATSFERSLREATATNEPEPRLERLDAALATWRGEALAEFRGAGWADREATRLDALRLHAQTRRAEALIEMRRHVDAAPELERLITDHPFDEHLVTTLATAYYRAGRPTDGLRALADLRGRLSQELGAAPGPAAVDLEAQILQHAPALAVGDEPTDTAPGPSSSRPAGMVTFLFVDLEASTRALQSLGDERYADVLTTYRAIVREACRLHAGSEFGTAGDGLFTAFRRASDAVAAAARAQRSLGKHPWPPDVIVRARMGVHTGEAELVAGDYVGLPVHVAARVCSAANGGQVLLTGATLGLVEGVAIRSLGEHQLRDVAQAVLLYQLVVTGTRDDARAPRASGPPLSNIPLALDGFVGRTAELRLVQASLAENRLVTLSGPGGVGKTRLALEAAAASVARYPDGIWFVELGTETEPARVAGSVAEVLALGEPADVPIERTVLDWLRSRNLLLVLDNCEHVLDAVGQLAVAMLQRCAGVRLLATSRERLRVRGEHVVALPPLSLESDAQRLFAVRAAAAAPEALIDDLELVTRICRRLDGLPLAIELAAARLSGLSLVDLDARLDDRFRLLADGHRVDQPRHQTLGAVVAWSYDLLDTEEQMLLDACSVFTDDFSVEAAEEVAGSQREGQAAVLEGLVRLVDKSLLTRSFDHNGRTRYRMLETLRQYGHDRLDQTGQISMVLDRLVAWALIRVEHLERRMRTPDQDIALRDAAPDRANLRRAMEVALERQDRLAALRIVSAAPVAPVGERRTLIHRLLHAARGHPHVAAQACLTSCNLAFEQGDWAGSIDDGAEARQRFGRLGDRRLAAWAGFMEAFSRWGAGDVAAADEVIAEVLATFRELRDDFGQAYALWFASQREPDLMLADRLAAEAEGLLRAFGASIALAHDLEGRGLIAVRSGDFGRANALLSEALRRFADSGNMGCAAHCLEAIGALLLTTGHELEGVAELAGAADALRDASGQQHRPWELGGHYAIEHALSSTSSDQDVGAARARGRAYDLTSAVECAAILLG